MGRRGSVPENIASRPRARARTKDISGCGSMVSAGFWPHCCLAKLIDTQSVHSPFCSAVEIDWCCTGHRVIAPLGGTWTLGKRPKLIPPVPEICHGKVEMRIHGPNSKKPTLVSPENTRSQGTVIEFTSGFHVSIKGSNLGLFPRVTIFAHLTCIHSQCILPLCTLSRLEGLSVKARSSYGPSSVAD